MKYLIRKKYYQKMFLKLSYKKLHYATLLIILFKINFFKWNYIFLLHQLIQLIQKILNYLY